jgi:hypothetical protein
VSEHSPPSWAIKRIKAKPNDFHPGDLALVKGPDGACLYFTHQDCELEFLGVGKMLLVIAIDVQPLGGPGMTFLYWSIAIPSLD